MDRNIDEIEFTIFDTETTGLEPESGDRVVEIAGIRFKADKQISNFHSLVNPHRQICEAAAKVNNGVTIVIPVDAAQPVPNV